MNTSQYFAGGNTADGFYSCFHSIMPAQRQKRMFYLKGGPGVGKSSFMRQVARAAEKADQPVELFYCSSDPDSLDGVALPRLGAAIMDGTAPHVMDPVIPAARDTLLSLGDYLDEQAMRPLYKELQALQAEISRRFARCYQYLSAARAVARAAAQGGEDTEKADCLAKEWTELLPRRGGCGTLRPLFAAACTPKGTVELLSTLPIAQGYTVTCPLGLHPRQLMTLLTAAALSRGLQVTVLKNPLEPELTDGLFLPEQGLYFGREGRDIPQQIAPMERLFVPAEGSEKEQSFDRNAYELLHQRAVEQLKAAKALHDELEQPYIAHMDFEGWQRTLDRVLGELGLA